MEEGARVLGILKVVVTAKGAFVVVGDADVKAIVGTIPSTTMFLWSQRR